MSLAAHEVTYAAGGRPLLSGVTLRAAGGEVHAILGPNGAGKSTLLRLLSGDIAPDSGRIEYGDRALRDWTGARLAQLRAVLPQRDQLTFGFTAEDVVRLGRLPFGDSPARECEIAQGAMALAGVAHLRLRRYPTLSGGERARVQLARVLAQIWEPCGSGPRALLLDEPTASLDLAHQHRCMQTVRDFAGRGVAVVVVLHDPNLAMTYADRVTLLCCGERAGAGSPEDVLTPEALSRIYGVDACWLTVPGEPRPHLAIRPQPTHR